MNETKVILTITHKKPLPAQFLTVLENRFYMWAFSQGVEVGVKAELVEEKTNAPQ